MLAWQLTLRDLITPSKAPAACGHITEPPRSPGSGDPSHQGLGAEEDAGVGTQPGCPEGPRAKLEVAGRPMLHRVGFSEFCSCTLCGNPINVTWELSAIYNLHIRKGSADQMFQSQLLVLPLIKHYGIGFSSTNVAVN